MAHPAADRVGERGLEAFGDVEESGRARAAVQIFVGAADREVDVGGGDIERDGADAVAEVPEHQRAGGMGARGPVGEVEAVGGLVMDVGEEEQRGIVVERVGELVARHHL